MSAPGTCGLCGRSITSHRGRACSSVTWTRKGRRVDPVAVVSDLLHVCGIGHGDAPAVRRAKRFLKQAGHEWPGVEQASRAEHIESAARMVVANWEHGNLAGAVNSLRLALESKP